MFGEIRRESKTLLSNGTCLGQHFVPQSRYLFLVLRVASLTDPALKFCYRAEEEIRFKLYFQRKAQFAMPYSDKINGEQCRATRMLSCVLLLLLRAGGPGALSSQTIIHARPGAAKRCTICCLQDLVVEAQYLLPTQLYVMLILELSPALRQGRGRDSVD